MKKAFVFIIFFLFIMRVDGTSTIVMDTDNKRVLYSSNVHDKRSVASISKIMTCIVALENGDINKKIVIGDEITGSYGSGIYIKKGEELSLKDLLYGLMLRSGNDAALAIANIVAGSEKDFVLLMNEKAKELKMTNTTFNNPSGLDYNGGNISTAYDMAILTSYAMQNNIYKEIVGTKKYTLKTNMNTYMWYNKNKLLHSTKYITGGKTGFTEIARRTLVTTATKDNLNLVVVTLNDGNDFKNHLDLYESTFKKYKSYKILKKGKINIVGEKHYNNLYIKNDFYYPLNEYEVDNIVLKFKLDKDSSSDIVGKVIVYFNDSSIYEDNVYQEIEKKKENIFIKIYNWLFK